MVGSGFRNICGRDGMTLQIFEIGGLALATTVLALVFGSALVGLVAQRILPESASTGGSRDMVGAVVGLVTLLLALVLGLLIWTAFGVYSTQKASIQQLTVNVLRIDKDLHDYGPEGDSGRALLRDLTRRGVEHIWNPDPQVEMGYVHALSGGQEMQRFLDGLQPATDAQKSARADASAAANTLTQTRLQMALALNDPLSYPLLDIVIAWAMALFFGYGFLSKATSTAFVAAAMGALAIASAIYAIDDLSTPYAGLFRVSPQPIHDALQAIDALASRAGGNP